MSGKRRSYAAALGSSEGVMRTEHVCLRSHCQSNTMQISWCVRGSSLPYVHLLHIMSKQ